MIDEQTDHSSGTTARMAAFRLVGAAVNLEQREQMLARHGTGRARKPASKMRQTQLPLTIVSKGRFDKSEPTIHKGEDLDIPTYIRRGVALN